MVVTPLDKLFSVVDNKYKAIVVVAKEARRLNKSLKEKGGDALSEKPTITAIRKLLGGELQYKEEEEC
jgi:DNA-directed RNA polymerase omega subunit